MGLDRENVVRFGTYNIRNRINRELYYTLRGMAQDNLDLCVFQETNITEGVNTCEAAG